MNRSALQLSNGMLVESVAALDLRNNALIISFLVGHIDAVEAM